MEEEKNKSGGLVSLIILILVILIIIGLYFIKFKNITKEEVQKEVQPSLEGVTSTPNFTETEEPTTYEQFIQELEETLTSTIEEIPEDILEEEIKTF